MTAEDLIQALDAGGARILAVGDKLRIEAPKGVLTEEIRRLLVQYKPEVLALLVKR